MFIHAYNMLLYKKQQSNEIEMLNWKMFLSSRHCTELSKPAQCVADRSPDRSALYSACGGFTLHSPSALADDQWQGEKLVLQDY